MTAPDFSLMHTEALRELVADLRREVQYRDARGRDARRVRLELEAAEHELATR